MTVVNKYFALKWKSFKYCLHHDSIPAQLDSVSSKGNKLDPKKVYITGATGLSVGFNVHYNKWTFENALSGGGPKVGPRICAHLGIRFDQPPMNKT